MGATDKVNAVTSQLLAAASDADTTAVNITASMSRLITQLDNLDGNFAGAAAGAFAEAKATMQVRLGNITDALSEVASGVRTSGQDFDVADQESQKEVSKIIADLNG